MYLVPLEVRSTNKRRRVCKWASSMQAALPILFARLFGARADLIEQDLGSWAECSESFEPDASPMVAPSGRLPSFKAKPTGSKVAPVSHPLINLQELMPWLFISLRRALDCPAINFFINRQRAEHSGLIRSTVNIANLWRRYVCSASPKGIKN